MGLTQSQRNLLWTPNPLSKRRGYLSNVPLPFLSVPRRSIGAIGWSVGVTGRTVGPGDLLPDTEVDYFERDDFDDFWTKTSTTDFDIVESPVYEGGRDRYKSEMVLDGLISQIQTKGYRITRISATGYGGVCN